LFTGPGEVFYFDFAAEANIDALTFRVGVNNAFDKQPPQYAPNVQSGTDPSLYDVIGRRAYVSARLKF
jgi:outer membrane receptor protein involved in Fe transport